MKETIKEKLLDLADDRYRKFASSLLPNTDNILGVRLPLLRKLAREIAGGDWRGYLEKADQETDGPADHEADREPNHEPNHEPNRKCFEEIMLQGLVLGYIKADIEETLRYVAEYIPKISNWSVCDSFCTSLKFTNNHKERVWNFLQTYFISKGEYNLRFGIVMLLDFYIEEEYIDRVLLLLDNVKHEGYYVKMAVAWAISICYVKLPEPTMKYLRKNTLDDFTYNKSLQKIIESYRVDTKAKEIIRSMKRK